MASAAALLAGVLMVLYARVALRHDLGQAYSERARETARRTDRIIAGMRANIRLWAEQPVMQGLASGDADRRIAVMLKSVGERYPEYDSVMAVDAHGRVVAASRHDLTGLSLTDRPWFSDLSAAGEQVLDAAPDPVSAEMVLTLVIPVRDAGDANRLQGALVAGFKLSALYGLLGGNTETGREDGEQFLIARKDGLLLSAPPARAAELFKRNLAQEGLQAFAGATEAERNGFSEQRVQGHLWVIGYAEESGWHDYHGLGWRIFILRDSRSAFAPVTRMAWFAFALSLMMALGAIVWAFWVAAAIANPLAAVTRVAAQIAGGDLTGSLHSRADDPHELAVLSDTFRAMNKRLAETIAHFRKGSHATHDTANRLDNSAGNLLEGARTSLTETDSITETIEELAAVSGTIDRSVHNFLESNEQTAGAVIALIASIEEIARSAQQLDLHIEESVSGTNGMVDSIQSINHTVGGLNELSEQAATSMSELDAMIRGVESSAASNRQQAEAATREAELGGAAIQAATEGMEVLRSRVTGAATAISALNNRSLEIGEIVSVISAVADQTSLLALNAAIIAAQAGEQGQGFAVVAEEVRKLASSTARSSKEIKKLIDAVRGDVANVTLAMEAGVQAADDGTRRQQVAAQALKRILSQVNTSAQMMAEIAQATGEQTRAVGHMTNTLEQVRGIAASIGKATGIQSQSGTQVRRAVEVMRDISRVVSLATQHQHNASQNLRDAISRGGASIGQIAHAQSENAAGARSITLRAERLRSQAQSNLQEAEQVRTYSIAMRGQASGIEGELQRFKTN